MKKAQLNADQIEELKNFKNDKKCTANELKRVQAILLINDGKHAYDFIPTMTGYTKKYAFALRKKYIKLGIVSIKEKSKSFKNILTKAQKSEIANIVKTKSPKDFKDEYGYELNYWNVPVLADLIKQKYNVQYKSKTSLYLIFEEAKFSYHKPEKQYEKRNQAAIEAWKEEKTPIIQALLNEESTVVLTEDEMILTSKTTMQKAWLPTNKSIMIEESCKRGLQAIYGFLNIKTGQEHAFQASRCNSEETIESLKGLMKIYPNHKIVVIWDNAKWHASQAIKDFLKKTTEDNNGVAVFHLINFPPYSPELNPQEHVWKAGRSNVTHNNFIADIELATKKFIGYLNIRPLSKPLNLLY